MTATSFLLLQCQITIGKISFSSVTEFEIKSSWKDITDTATITLPRNLKYKDLRIDQMIKRGDPVTIKAGANGTLNTEFVGYVREVEPNVPLRITCEDEMFKLKGKLFTQSWTSASLNDIIKYITAGSGYTYDIDNITLGKFMIKNASAAQVISNLQEWGIYTYFRYTDNGGLVLHSGFAYPQLNGLASSYSTHTYHFQKNIKKNDLHYRLKDSILLQVKAIANLPTGKKTIVLIPEELAGAEVRTLNFGELSTDEATRKALLKKYATSEMQKFNIDGYRGSITGFAIPYGVKHGDNAKVIDERYPDRTSVNIIDSVTVKFGDVYFERTMELGPRIS